MNFRVTAIALLVILFGIYPAGVLAQTTNPSYIAEMPSVDRVMAAMQASDPDETAARQMGAFWQLKTMIEEIAGPRYYKPGLTPEEAKLRQAYYTAYFQLSNSKPQYKSFVAMRGYDINPKFRDELIKKLFPLTFSAEYPKLVAQAKTENQAVHNRAEQNRAKQAAEDQAAAQKQFNKMQADFNAGKSQAQMSPEQRTLNRCITAGRLPASCAGNWLLGGFTQMISSVLPSLAKEPPPGLNMAGVFQGAGNWRLDFIEGGVLVNCAFLSPNQQNYTIDFKNGHTSIIVDTTPKPLVLTLTADGNIVGPGPLQIDGVVAAGTTGGGFTPGHNESHEVTTYTQQPCWNGGSGQQGCTLYSPAGTFNQATTHTETTQVGGTYVAPQTTFAPRRATCPALNLSSKGAGVGVETMQTNLLKTMFGGDKGPPTPPGLRMHGNYTAQTGFSVEFYPESAIVACGEPARAYPYQVVANGSQPAVKIEDPGRPLMLNMRPDGSLDPGTGSYVVHGRRIIGKDDNGDFKFAPLETTCNLAVLVPGAAAHAPAPGQMTVANAPAASGVAAKNSGSPMSTSAAPTGNAVLSVVSGLPNPPNAPNPLAMVPVTLLRDSVAGILTKAGVPIPPGTSAQTTIASACRQRAGDCQKINEAMNANAVTAMRADPSGKATLPGVPPGTYFLMLSGRYNNQPLFWELKLDLKAGANTVTLDQHNASLLIAGAQPSPR